MSEDVEIYYSGRPRGVVNVNLSVDREAWTLLKGLVPHKKAHGKYLSRLIYEHCARREGREEARQRLAKLLDETP